ncbi:MAG: VOC family protein [Chloroflexi bacterium]|nr:VOC family protein [Chloroflexota bacterium]
MATVRYMVSDAEAATAFYTENLGFTIKMQSPNFCMVSLGDLTLWLSGPRSSARRPMPDGREPEPGGWNRLLIEVDDIEAEVKRLTRAGVQFRNEIISGPGGKQILAEDLDGNPIELFEAG